jgi:hypothetical protein
MNESQAVSRQFVGWEHSAPRAPEWRPMKREFSYSGERGDASKRASPPEVFSWRRQKPRSPDCGEAEIR